MSKTSDKKIKGKTGSSPKKKTGQKKKRKKNGPMDRIQALVLAGAIVFTAAIAALTTSYYLHSTEAVNDAAAFDLLYAEAAEPEETFEEAPQAPPPLAPPPPASRQTVPPPPERLSLPAERQASPPHRTSAPAEITSPPVLERAVPERVLPAAAIIERAPERAVPERTSPPAERIVPERISPPPERTPPPERVAPENVTPAAAIIERPPEPSLGTLVFVIDDAGNNLRELDLFLKFPGPITIAVLPGLPNSVEAARRIRDAGKDLFLHQPMESLGGSYPGPGAIYSGMERDEIRTIVNRNLDELWPVTGMNNHEGSRVTMDDEIMEIILEICREREIPFLDSRTTAETAAPRVARRLNVNIGQRDVFLDNNQDSESILEYINMGLSRAEQRGSAIMLGHTWSPALAPLLLELYDDLSSRGYTFSTASELIGEMEL